MEGAQSGLVSEAMTLTDSIDPSKTEHGENFPVASHLIAARLRTPILSFYRFARAADDIADHPGLSENSKLAGLNDLEDTLLGPMLPNLRWRCGTCWLRGNSRQSTRSIFSPRFAAT